MVVCGDGTSVEDDTGVLVDKFIKLMYFDGHKCCIVRRKEDGEYVTVHQHQERENLWILQVRRCAAVLRLTMMKRSTLFRWERSPALTVCTADGLTADSGV